MKISLGILFTLFLFSNSIQSQNCDFDIFNNKLERATTKNDSLNLLMKHLECLNSKQDKINSSLGEMLITLNTTNEYVVEEKEDFKIINSGKHSSLKQNLEEVPDIFEEVNDNIYNIKDKLIQHDLENYIKELYNPESNITGRKFSTILSEQLKIDVVDNLNLGDSKTDKVLKTVESITNTPLLQAIPSFDSAIKITTEVIGFIRNIIYRDDTDNLKLIQNFEKNIAKYLIFYGELDKANQKYQFKINEVQARVDVEYLNYNEYLLKTAKIAGFEYSIPKSLKNLKTINDDLITKFDDFLRVKANSLNNTNYFEDLKNNKKLIKFNNDLDNLKYFLNELKEIFELYNSINIEYKNTIKTILTEKGINITESKQKQIAEKLDKLQERSLESTNILFNFKNLKDKLKRIEFSDIHL